MKKIRKVFIFILFVILLNSCKKIEVNNEKRSDNEIELPKPKFDSSFSVEKALSERKSIRSFKDEALGLEEISQLLWAAQGIDGVTGATRTAPSAGATQPLEIYLVVNNVEGLAIGIYHYNPAKHTVKIISDKEIESPYKSPFTIVIAAAIERTAKRYGNRAVRYVDIEVGHVAQNIHLQAISLGLGSFPIGAFGDEAIKNELGIKEEPLYIIPVGKI